MRQMANEKNLKPFKKGWEGGPGRPSHPPELKAIKQMSQGEFKALVYKIINSAPEDLNNFRGTVLELALASTIQKAIKEGDQSRIEFFLQRLFGKVPDKLEVSDAEKLKEMSDEDLIKEAERLTEERKQLIAKEKSK